MKILFEYEIIFSIDALEGISAYSSEIFLSSTKSHQIESLHIYIQLREHLFRYAEYKGTSKGVFGWSWR